MTYNGSIADLLGPARLCVFLSVASFACCEGTSIEGDAGTDSDASDPGTDAADTEVPDPGFDPADTSPDTFTDAMLDIDTTLDNPADATVDPEAEPPVDAPWDVPPEVPVTTCNVIDQMGCPDGTWCSWSVDDFTCGLHQTCFSRTPGDVEPGGRCDLGGVLLCQPGSECYWNEADPPDLTAPISCHQWCRTDADCTIPGSWCGFDLEQVLALFGPCAGIVTDYPYLLCYHTEG